MRILIKNGYVIDPATNREGFYDVLTEDERIFLITKTIKEEEAKADLVVDATGKHVLPGFIDLHVHYREPGLEYKETIATGSAAAAAGGYTTVCPMPNTKPTTDCAEVVKYVLDKAKEAGKVRVLPVGAVTLGQSGIELADMQAMKAAGAAAVSEDGKSVMNPVVYAEGMRKAKEAGLPVFAHCEDISLVRGGVMNAGAKAEELGLPGITNAVEDIITMRDILLAEETGAQLHLCHCSTKYGVDFVRFAKEKGIPVTAEVCPHHFAMCDEEIPCDDANYKMNPPLRGKEDVDALIAGLLDGTMSVISTDHAPHSAEEKQGSMVGAPFGIVGSETAYALSNTVLVKERGMTPMQLAACMSYHPAQVLGREKELGGLAEGYYADIAIVAPDEEYTVCTEEFLSKGKNTPFGGKRVKGRVYMTICAGTVTYTKEMKA
ncbi:MAG: dihydroorotase [Lachnospiraceae bacterium]|nr:dihydroorotase [Lachnospiraceae bacterium]